MAPQISVVKRDQSTEPADRRKILQSVERACRGLADVDAGLIADEAMAQLFDNITSEAIHQATIRAARSRVALEPAYSYVAARLLLFSVYREVFGHRVDARTTGTDTRAAFERNLIMMVGLGRFDKRLLTVFDLERLAAALEPERDLTFKFLGMQTIYDRYLARDLDGRLVETPQTWWMRVAMGLCLEEDDPTARAIAAYELFSRTLYCPATPTLFNSGTTRPQLSSCFLSTIDDSIEGIFGLMYDQARLSKWAGGIGVDFTPVRGIGAHIHGTNGKSQGSVPFMQVLNSVLLAVNQGGKRNGKGCAYLETWHIDMPDFLDLHKRTGDDRRRARDLHTANWIPDEFMQRVENDDEWWLFSPDECPDLHSRVGEVFSQRYQHYVQKAKRGKMKVARQMRARELWKHMLTSIWETGHPWETFKDASNLRYTNQHLGTVNSSNLCTETHLHTIAGEETAVCTLGSANLAAHADDAGVIDYGQLEQTVRIAGRLLDNAVSLNFYPTTSTAQSHLAHRPVGIGTMGWADLFHKQRIACDSDAAVELSNSVQEFVSFHAIDTSCELARERGRYPTYEGSLWSQGILPIDSYRRLMRYRGQDDSVVATAPWDVLRERVLQHGMRNSNVMAGAPTATIASICGCSQSINPDYAVVWVYSTLSGEFTEFNEFFVARMKELSLWTEDLAREIQRADGDISAFKLPAQIREEFKTAHDMDQHKLIDAAAVRQIWIDQGLSLNLFGKKASLQALSNMYLHAWRRGLKSTYYLRTKAANSIEKTSLAQTCQVGESCEACQ
jgi:ribonucleoside-diphosphate reductase alpha chain